MLCFFAAAFVFGLVPVLAGAFFAAAGVLVVFFLRGEALAAMRFEHIDIGEIGKGRAVGDDAGKADLIARRCEGADAQGTSDRALDSGARNIGGPIASRQKGVDRIDLHIGRVE